MIGAILALIIIARSLVPVAGVFFLGWPADRVLVLFFTDTMMGFAALSLAMAFSSSGSGKTKSGGRVRRVVGGLVGTLFLLGIVAIPLGAPLVIMLANSEFSIVLTLHDWSFQHSLEIQAMASALWCGSLIWQLRTRTPEDLGFGALFTLILLRWLILAGVAFSGLPLLLGRGGPYLLVVVFVAAVLLSEINPVRFLRLMPGKRRASRAPGRP